MMKLISCYIENYGCISQKNIEFKEGLNVICEGNGQGKTTLASFIKAMLYGLAVYTKATTAFTDREHFYPFNGGRFGGCLTLEHAGRTYRIERFFHKKRAVEDEYHLFCDGAPIDEGDVPIGKQLLGIDEASFLRTTFMDAKQLDDGITTDIGRAMNRLIDHTSEEADYDSAGDILVKRRKELKADRGRKGKIYSTQDELISIQNEVTDLRRERENLAALYSEREKLDSQRKTLEKQKEMYNAQALLREKKSVYEGKLASIEANQEALDRLYVEYPNGLPSEKELETLSPALEEMSRLMICIKESTFSKEKEERLESHTARFRENPPTEQDLAALDAKITELERILAELSLKRESDEDEEKLCARFERGRPREDELADMRRLAQRYRTAKERAEGVAVTPIKRSPLPMILLGGGCTLLAVGVLLFFLMLPLGIAFCALGALGVAGGLVKHLLDCKSRDLFLMKDRQNQDLTNEAEQLRARLQEILARWGYSLTSSVEEAIFRVEADLSAYEKLLKKRKEQEERSRFLQGNQAQIEREVRAFLSVYGIGDNTDVRRGAQSLRFLLEEYRALLKEKKELESQITRWKQEATKQFGEIKSILTPYKIKTDDALLLKKAIETMKQARKELDRLLEDKEKLQRDANNYRASFSDDPLEVGEAVDGEAVTAELNEHVQLLAARDRQIEDIEFRLEKLPILEGRAASKQEELETIMKKHDLLVAAYDFLKTAEQNQRNRYVAPVMERFKEYSSLLERTLGESVSMDMNFRISYENHGEFHRDKFLSMGQYAISALCMRLALVDNIFHGEHPFIVMDDPFLTLDAEHLDRVASALATLSDNVQIIYFTCHESRSLCR